MDFVRIVGSHEHFVSLNLPSVNPLLDNSGIGGGAASPSPSIRSNDSQSSFIAHSTVSNHDRVHWAELTNDFKRKHFLVGVIMNLLSKALDQS